MDVSTPEDVKTDFSHRATEDDTTGECGFFKLKKSCCCSDFTLKEVVIASYLWRHSTGHSKFSGKARNSIGVGKLSGLLCFANPVG